MSVLPEEIPQDWYRTAFADTADMAWTDRTEEEINRALNILRPPDGARVLDLACGAGRHSLELRRRGFEVVGADISPELLDIARRDAEDQNLEVEFVEDDLRELDFDAEFDVVLSLNDGAIGYFETDEENLRSFAVISRALRPNGQHLMQLPNVLFAQKHLPRRSWIEGDAMIELVEHRWNKSDRYLEGAMIPIRFGEILDGLRPIQFRQRLYTVDEMRQIFTDVGMTLENTFHGGGRPKEPRDSQFEVFVASRKS
jgi:SAM-dependent methyltransferase